MYGLPTGKLLTNAKRITAATNISSFVFKISRGTESTKLFCRVVLSSCLLSHSEASLEMQPRLHKIEKTLCQLKAYQRCILKGILLPCLKQTTRVLAPLKAWSLIYAHYYSMHVVKSFSHDARHSWFSRDVSKLKNKELSILLRF